MDLAKFYKIVLEINCESGPPCLVADPSEIASNLSLQNEVFCFVICCLMFVLCTFYA